MIFRIFRKLYNIIWKLRKKEFKCCGAALNVGYGFSVREPQNISIGDRFIAGNNCKLEVFQYYKGNLTGYLHNLVVKNDVRFTNNDYISCVNEIVIGSGCLFGDNVFVTDNFHGDSNFRDIEIPPVDRNLISKGAVVIGNNVWLGRNVCVMPNVAIGDYAVIGANSVVTHDIPAYAVAAGCPARVIKMIKDD